VSTRGAKRLRSLVATVEARWFVAVSVLLLVTGAIFVGRLAQRSQAQVIASAQHVTLVMDVEARARAIRSGMIGAEHAVRAYIISGVREDAQPYNTALAELPGEFLRLRELTRGNSAQQAHLDQLETLVNECLGLLGHTIVVHDAGDHETAFALLLAGHVPALMDVIRSATSLVVLEEQRSLAGRQQQLAGTAAVGRASLVYVVVVTAAFVAGVLFLALKVGKLQRLARMCAWSRTIEYQGEWLSFEEYLRRRFRMETTHGISPAEAAKMRTQVPSA